MTRRRLVSFYFWPLVIFLVSLLLTRHLWLTRAWIETHDGIFHVIRMEEFAAMFRLGQFPVRWAGSLDNGFGLPLFNYLYPGPYYFGLPLMLLGISAKWVVKLLLIGLYFSGGLGVYFLFAQRKKPLAAFCAVLYLLTPYFLLNIFVRGALGEVAAMAFFPWVIFSFRSLSEGRALKWYHPLPLFFLLISHNFLGLLFLPLLLVLIFFGQARRLAILNLVISFGLAAFFLLPMFGERGLIQSVFTQDFTYRYRDHFVYLSQLIFPSWGNGYSVRGPGDQLSFQLGLPHLFFAALALFFAFRRPDSNLSKWLAFLFLALFFLSPLSQPVWQLFPPLQIIQFPWRFLAFAALTFPFLAFAALSHLSPRQRSFTMVLALVFGGYFALLYSTPAYTQNNAQFATQLYIHRHQTTTSSRRELLPRWAPPEEQWKGEEARIVSGQADLTVTASTPLNVALHSVTNDPNSVYLIRRHYFPSWQARDEKGNHLSLSPSPEGEISLQPQLGVHDYTIFVGASFLEKLGNALTLISLFIFSFYLLRSRYNSN